MNVFEDLIVELKGENLLESTVTESNAAAAAQASKAKDKDKERPELKTHRGARARALDELAFAHAQLDFSEQESDGAEPNDTELVEEAAERVIQTGAVEPVSAPVPGKPANGKEFYRKRAIGELSNLQTVEHVLTGVEREYLKIIPKTFDDFNAKKALNSFLQVNEGENSPEHAEAEFNLMRETESWCTCLSDRDRHIPVSAIRRYCETSRPALSSQALVSLARFYRNLPYTEAVRGKFDFVITRVFTKGLEDDKRVPLFTREEILDRINMLYREWSSIPLYCAEADESNIMLTVLTFEELANEAESASSFDLLISSDFFGRMRMFKESISDLFYAPSVTAAAVECNVRVGNAYVDLIDRQRQQMDAGSIRDKYGDVDDVVICDATSKTLVIGEYLDRAGTVNDTLLPSASFQATGSDVRQRSDAASRADSTADGRDAAADDSQALPFHKRLFVNAWHVNPWIAIVSAVLIVASIGVFLWSNQTGKDTATKAGVQVLGVDGTFLGEHLGSARISGETVYGMVEASWNTLPGEKRQEFLKRMLEIARDKGCTQVNLINKDGKAVGYISAARVDVNIP